MKRTIALVVAVAFALNVTFEGGALAFSSGSSASQGNPASSQMGQIAESAGPVQSFQADLFTGRAQTSVPIFVPPGRKKIQPSLNLSYSSSGGNSWLGASWNLDMGFIQRDLKRGVPSYGAGDKFLFSFQGVSSELVSVAANEYRARDEALFLKFVFDPSSNSWMVTDKSGTKHWFGLSPDCRQTNSLGTFKWAISKVEDTSGNSMLVSHVQDGGEMYLSSIDYNGNTAQNFSPTHRVEFTLEDRPDKSFSYITGTRVELNKRLKEIQVKVKDGAAAPAGGAGGGETGLWQLARKYAISYQLSASSQRSLLSQVTEYGKDGLAALPPVTFTYQDKVLGFESMIDFPGIQRALASWTDSDFPRMSSGGDTSVDMLDLNGDGRNDRIQSVTGNTNWKIQLNQGPSFGPLQDFGPLEKPTSWAGFDYVSELTQKKQATDLLDINGDGLPDRIIAQDNNTSWLVQVNSGSGLNPSIPWGPVERMTSTAGNEYIRYTGDSNETLVDWVDMNGDGLPDRVQAQAGNPYWKVQFNTGTGFGAMVDFGPVERMAAGTVNDAIRLVSSSFETRVDLVDLNGDGLPDRVQAADGNLNWKVQWNTGRGFSPMEDFGPIVRAIPVGKHDFIRAFSDTGAQMVDLFDINGDGLPDRVQAEDYNTVWKVQINTGKGFKALQDYGPIENMTGEPKYSFPRWTNASSQIAVDMADMDGDGMADRIQAAVGSTAWKVQKNKGPYPDLLSRIDNGRGGRTTIHYSPSTSFDNRDTNGKERLPFSVQVVTQVKQEDGMGNSYVTSYLYKGGLYSSSDREFRGFREVTITDAAGTQTISTFGQDDHNKGKLLEKDVKDSSGNLFSKEVTTWGDTHPWGTSVDVHFVHADQVDTYIFDGDSNYKQVRTEYTYDDYGDIASTTEDGDISATGDERKTVNTYVYGMAAPGSGTGTYIVNTLSKTTLYAADLTTIKAEKYFYYDGATSIVTAPAAGLLTKQEEWLNTASGCGTPGVCTNNPKTTMTYDSYGNVATVTDARGYINTNTYDSTYHMFLTQISNALSQTRSFTYDPWLGQILTSTDQNGQVAETQYDVLGRITKVIAPLDSSTEPTQEFTYDYPTSNCTSNCTTRLTTKVKSSVPGQTFTQLVTYSFVDGLGREIQRRSPAEDSTKQIISGGVEFDSRGLVSKQYVPYFENSTTSYVATDTTKPKATFTYDAVARRTRIDYPDGTNSQVAYNKFVKTTTDQRGKQLRYTNDAYERIAKVEEFNAGSTYTTTYEYDAKNNLTKTTDNVGNQTTISYDSLSRKTAMSDPDMGTWSYTYDVSNNLVSQTDAKSQTISFTYDALDRITLKDLPSGETDVIYSYDSAPSGYSGQTGYWVGRLAKISDSSGDHEFLYDKQGRILKDKKTVDSVSYEFVRTYDSIGRVQTLTYPDTEVVTYTYNGFGDVETIQGVKSGVTTDYIKQVDYNASGQIAFTKYGNNVTSNYTYDSNTLRLSNILTKKPDGTTKLQDLSYTFDGNGNVTHVGDAINSMTQDFTYDDLNRLTQAIGSAYGTQSFSYDSIGNMTNKAGRTMSYGTGSTPARPHAVTNVTWSGNKFPTFCRDLGSGNCTLGYDGNGNMTTRGQDILSYDSENRLKEAKVREGESSTISYTLKPGWNVISFPALPDDRGVPNVLSSLTFGTDYDQVSYWDASASGTDKWKHWVNDSDFNDFTQFEYGKTYEIYNKSGIDKSFSVSGKTSAIDITHNIVSGDNFISPAVKTATSVSTVLSGLTLGTHYSDVKRFNATTQTWESYQGGAFTQFEPGKGYNIIGLTTASFSYGKTETTTTFIYDSNGARIKKTAAGTTTIYFGNDYEVEGAVSTKHIFLGDRRITTKKSNGDIFFIHTDHINSTNVVTDGSGNQSVLLEYDPYGETATFTGSADLKYKYTGKERDDSTKLYFYAWRYYDPQLGRFTSPDTIIPDPSNPQEFNRYSYVNNNPIKYTDPTGHKKHSFWKSFLKWTGIIVGAIAGIAFGVGLASVLMPVMHAALGATFGSIVGGAMAGAGGAVFGNGVANTFQGRNPFSGAGTAAIAGAAFGGFDAGYSRLVPKASFGSSIIRVGLDGAVGGAVSEITGGDFWTGAAFSSIASGSRLIYRAAIALRDPSRVRDPFLTPSNGQAGDKDLSRTDVQMPIDSTSGWGMSNVGNVNSSNFFTGEKGLLMRFVSLIPSFNGLGYGHDNFMGAVHQAYGNSFAKSVINYTTIPVAGAVNTAGSFASPAAAPILLYQAKRND